MEEVELCLKSLSDEKVRKVLSAHISSCPLCSFLFVILMRHALFDIHEKSLEFVRRHLENLKELH